MPKTVAVIGASRDRSKFGNKSVRAHRRQGWTVYPVNPGAQDIEGLRCYASISDVPGPLDRVSLYLPPERGITLLQDIADRKPQELFLNPGADSDKLVARAQGLGLNVIRACSIVDVGLSPAAFPDD